MIRGFRARQISRRSEVEQKMQFGRRSLPCDSSSQVRSLGTKK